MNRTATYDKTPTIRVSARAGEAWRGWHAILARLGAAVSSGARRIAVECYPGVFEDEIEEALKTLVPADQVFRTQDIWKDPREVDRMTARDLTDDPVFGRLNGLTIVDFADPLRRAAAMERLADHPGQPTVILGTGTALLEAAPDVLVFADLPRWEIQARQRSHRVASLGLDNLADSASRKYKRGFFIDWRVADRIRRGVLDRCDFLLDTNAPGDPKMVHGSDFRDALAHVTTRPFRVVPFFDPGPWGGQWMRDVCGLDKEAPNYAWCFDCVPEENSLLFDVGAATIEVSAINLVFRHPRELLGEAVHARFGTEFPIRFDFLDTMDGGNLSLQVHPLTEYIQDRFGMAYTQDESYYMLDAAPDACVYLGVKEQVDRFAMIGDLRAAQHGGAPFDAARYVNRWPARKHDHFLIPAGTIHCSGRNAMVLEISATPYIFTFKLWDWGRLGLDGKPRPIHLDHGIANIQWDRDTRWVRENLVSPIQPVASGVGWQEERTGLHRREFIETRRHWFTGVVPHDTGGGVHVLNLVEGEEAIVESPVAAFEPYRVHYAETFIVPAAVGEYTIRPASAGKRCGTIQASVRT